MKHLKKYMEKNELGTLEQSVPVTPAATTPTDTDDMEIHLVWSESGLYLVSAQSPEEGWSHRLTGDDMPIFELGPEAGSLRVDEAAFQVRLKYADETRLMIHRAQLLERGTAEREFHPKARHIESPTLPARVWLSAHLEASEDLLAWLPADSKPPLAERPDASPHFMLTSRRAALVVLSPSGDGEQWDLPEDSFVVEDPPESWLPLGRQDVRSGDLVWGVTRSWAPLYQELCPIVGWPLDEKLMELARWNWRKGDVVYASSLLSRAMRAGEPHAPVIFNLRPVAGDGTFPDLVQAFSSLVSEAPESTTPVGDEVFPDLAQALSALVSRPPDSARLVELCESWKIGFEQQDELLEQILALGEVPVGWAAPLYRRVHGQALEKEKLDVKKTEWSLGFAEYLTGNGLASEAVEILEKWLDTHQGFAARELLPLPSDSEPSTEQASRGRALELLEQARVEIGDSNEDVLLRLAQLHPLDQDFLSQLVGRAEGRARDLLSTVVALYAPGGLTAEDSNADAEASETEMRQPGRALETQRIDETLQHPEAREGSTWGTFQGLLASVREPDSGALRKFCERLEEGTNLQLAAADASFVLATPVPEIFISRGDQAVGLRAFESKPPFILVGSKHLDAASPMYLRPLEMRFGITAELAHLRYKHTRATAAEVREGALDKSLAALGFAVSLLPFAASASKLTVGTEVADKLTSALNTVPLGALETISDSAGIVWDLAGKFKGNAEEPQPKDAFLSMGSEDIVEAHRVMQLTADRAGLLLCGDLASAIRFMFLSSSTYHLEVPLLERLGLRAVLEKRHASGALLYEDLMIRIGALLAFYLSEDYRVLRRAVGF